MRALFAALAISLTFTACRSTDSSLPPEYRRIQVPQARLDSPEARSRGGKLFAANCALCHGERGDGRGLRSQGLAKPPTDFTNPAWRQRTTPRRVFFAIREGLRGTPMPGWKWLGEGAAWDLVAYVLSLRAPSRRAAEATPAAAPRPHCPGAGRGLDREASPRVVHPNQSKWFIWMVGAGRRGIQAGTSGDARRGASGEPRPVLEERRIDVRGTIQARVADAVPRS